MIKIMVVDDQELMREGLATILNLRPELEVIGTASNGKEAFEKACLLQPDIVLMDIRMPIANGVEGIRLIKGSKLGTKILMLTTFKDSELIFDALEEGASGYLLKDMPTETIIQAIMTVHSGGVVLPPDITSQVVKEIRKTQLLEQGTGNQATLKSKHLLEEITERELEVLKELGYGKSNKEIAEKLFITEGTVKNHVSNIINKLELRDRTQSAIFAVRYGISSFDT